MTIKNGTRAMLAAILTLTALGSSAAAQAQKISRPFAFKLGGHVSSDGVISEATNQVGFFGGLSYDIARSHPKSNLIYQAYIDYAHHQSWGGGGATSFYPYSSYYDKSTLLGVGPAVKLLLAPVTVSGQPYIGAGVGYYQARVPAYHILIGYSGEYLGRGLSGSRSAARLGGKVFAGYQVNTGFFWEADYTYVGEIEGLMPGGFGARLGFRL